VQLHNAPLRSYRKIRGKAAVQQSPSRRAHRRPSPKMHDVAVYDKQSVNAEQPKPTAAHHNITTARRPDNTRSSALVRSRSIRSLTGSGCQPRNRCSEAGFTFLPFLHKFTRLWPLILRLSSFNNQDSLAPRERLYSSSFLFYFFSTFKSVH